MILIDMALHHYKITKFEIIFQTATSWDGCHGAAGASAYDVGLDSEMIGQRCQKNRGRLWGALRSGFNERGDIHFFWA